MNKRNSKEIGDMVNALEGMGVYVKFYTDPKRQHDDSVAVYDRKAFLTALGIKVGVLSESDTYIEVADALRLWKAQKISGKVAHNRMMLRRWYVESKHKNGKVIISDQVRNRPEESQRIAEKFRRNIAWAWGRLHGKGLYFGYRMELLSCIERWQDFIKEVDTLNKEK